MTKDSPSPIALGAIRAIRALRKYPSSQTPHAEKKILAPLTVADYISVVLALEYPAQAQEAK
jgi:hypothetical protein